jgi:hypothetical protein
MFKEREKQQQSIKLSMRDGNIDFEGEMSMEVKELLDAALESAAYHKQKNIELQKKAAEIEEKKLNRICEIDFINAIYISCVVIMTTFIGINILTIAIDSFRPEQPQLQSRK